MHVWEALDGFNTPQNIEVEDVAKDILSGLAGSSVNIVGNNYWD